MNLFATNGWMDASNEMDAARRRPLLEVLSRRADNMKWKKDFCRVQLFLGLALTVFLAGIVVPNLVRPSAATRDALAAGSLHAIKIAGMTFLFTYKNLVAAILGVLIGGGTALVIEIEGARFWLRHVYHVLQVCLEDWGFGDTGGRSASTYISTRMSRQAVPAVNDIRLVTVRETEADRWIA
jgi:hypothetical protein